MSLSENESQEKLIHILIKNQNILPEFFSGDISVDYFDDKYKPIIVSLEECNHKSEKFTENYYIDFISRSVANGDYKKWTGNQVESLFFAQQAERRNYQLVTNLEKIDINDYPLVCRKVREHYIKQQSMRLFENFNKNSQKDYLSATRTLTDSLNNLVSDSGESASSWIIVDEYADDWYKEFEEELNNPKKILPTGIRPFDETMPAGMDIGSLTLIVADVGGFKSATMINIALNACKMFGENVLYVSLEMPKHRIMQRIISRESSVDSEKFTKPKMLSEKDKEKIKKAADDFKIINSKFAILDAQERMTVSKIRAELEKRKHFFRPRLVVVDYISILSPEPWYQKLAEHSWYGQMCKDLRQLGRKMGFGVLSAVQLNREAIKSLRNQKDGKQSVGSDALRGSHDFSADADNIYVQFMHPDFAGTKLLLFCVKSRNGSTMFGPLKSEKKAELLIYPNIGKVDSVDSISIKYDDKDAKEFFMKAEEVPPPNPDLDLSFDVADSPPLLKTKPVKNSVSDLGF